MQQIFTFETHQSIHQWMWWESIVFLFNFYSSWANFVKYCIFWRSQPQFPRFFFFKAYNNSTKCLGPGIPEPDPDPDSDPGKNTDRIRIRKPDLGHNPLHASGKRSRRNKCSEIVHWFTTKNILKLRLTISRVSASNEPIWWRRKLDRCSLSMVKNWRKEGFIYIHTYYKASSVGN